MTLTQRIKDKFGSLKHFSKIAEINCDSLSVIIHGTAKSQRCVDALIKHGFIKDATELKQYKEKEVA